MGYVLGIDVGGTFTDFLLLDEKGNTEIYKTSSTPVDPSVGTMEGLAGLALGKGTLQEFLSRVDMIVHGTTITTNAVLTGTYAKTGYITTKGFRDLLNERRGMKPHIYEPKMDPPEPIVPRYLIRGVEERVNSEGQEVIPLNEEDVYAAAELFRKERVEAVAVNFNFCFLNTGHEKRVKEILKQELPGVYICLSSDVLPQVRIYERGSTTVFNACLGPPLRAYITNLIQKLTENSFKGILLLMQSSGGVMSPEVAMNFAVNTLLSGPAGGPKAGVFYADTHEIKDIITVDMGGTSFDACLIRNREPEITVENEVAGYRTAMPSLAVHTIGAGGGSIAWVDPGGILRVGPRSAGAVPGPACYGTDGDEPTVTDANVILGYVNPDYFLGGKMKVYPEKAEESIKRKVADKLGLDIVRAAYGVYTVVNTNMAQGVRVASIGRGYDPRGCMLVVAGGAGPIHVCDIAKELEMPLMLVPKVSSVFCASGMLISDLRHDFVRVSYMILTEEHVDIDSINARYQEMKDKGSALLQGENVPVDRMRFIYSCDLRYEAQFNEIEVAVSLSSDGTFTMNEMPLLQQAFDQKHDALYGYNLPGSTLELICLRVVAEGITKKPPFRETPFLGEDASASVKGQRQVYHHEGFLNVSLYEGSSLGHGHKISGPAIIEETTTTIFLTPDYQLTCDKYDNYMIYPQGMSLKKSIGQLRE
ncbi:hydantoinase/oxoprolinase family protein [Chloroflexota bacterium]